MLLNIGVLIRAGCLVLATVNDVLLLAAIFMYFGSNFVPLMYMRHVADQVFEPVKVSGTDSSKIKFIIRKFGITKRETEIIMQICDGKTNQQIADDLFISLQTVKDHTHRIYSKIGIKSRMQLVQKLNP
jgi:DNA-binding CsgD family transcriptional regulator